MAKTIRKISKKEILDALKGVEAWVADIRTVLSKLPESTSISIDVGPPGGGGVRPMLSGCMPPDDEKGKGKGE